MKGRTVRTVSLTALTLGVAVLTAPPAHAYIDPNSSNFILQILIGGLVGGLLAVKAFGRNIMAGIRRLFGRKEKPPVDTPTE